MLPFAARCALIVLLGLGSVPGIPGLDGLRTALSLPQGSGTEAAMTLPAGTDTRADRFGGEPAAGQSAPISHITTTDLVAALGLASPGRSAVRAVSDRGAKDGTAARLLLLASWRGDWMGTAALRTGAVRRSLRTAYLRWPRPLRGPPPHAP